MQIYPPPPDHVNEIAYKQIGGLAKLIFKAALEGPNLLKKKLEYIANLMVVLQTFKGR